MLTPMTVWECMTEVTPVPGHAWAKFWVVARNRHEAERSFEQAALSYGMTFKGDIIVRGIHKAFVAVPDDAPTEARPIASFGVDSEVRLAEHDPGHGATQPETVPHAHVNAADGTDRWPHRHEPLMMVEDVDEKYVRLPSGDVKKHDPGHGDADTLPHGHVGGRVSHTQDWPHSHREA